MVYLVRKQKQGHTYLYLQKCIRVNGKKKTVHVAYLGKEDKFSDADIKREIAEANYKEAEKREQRK